MPRMFLGIPVPATAGLVAAAESLAEVDLEASGMRLAPVSDHQWHLTWAFLGFVPDEQVGELREAVSGCVARLLEDGLDATLRATGVGCFGGPVWAGIEFRHEGARAALDGARKDALSSFGWSESRAWEPHLTLGRAKTARDSGVKFVKRRALKAELAEWMEANEGLQDDWLDAPELVLFESKLTPHGATHTAVERWSLA
ncbi:MAG: RNA 2',3'-cyclic phosphodiesterase [Candidatus Poseidoniales archaeon]|nr:MAG: RNA 2',3'-cyclic phosphodiesterase [Candidatus Poseidoniales archaeon]